MPSEPERLVRVQHAIRMVWPVFRPAHDREHRTYARLRDGADPASEERRAFFEAAWAEYAPFAPRRFLEGLQIEFHQRWWEMYLTVALLRLGFAVETSAADAGPDVTLEVDGARLFIEAVAPMAGTKVDRVPEPVHHGVVDFPELECLSHLTQALTAKARVLRTYMRNGIVPSDACRIIALSATDLNQFGSMLDGTHPAPLSVLAAAGPLELTIDGTAPSRSSRREFLARDSGSTVHAARFDDPEFSIRLRCRGLACRSLERASGYARDFLFVREPDGECSGSRGVSGAVRDTVARGGWR